MANWTPQGFVGQVFKTMSKHVPPSPLMTSPLLWGVEETVRERFGNAVSELKLTRCDYPFHYAMSPAETVEFYRLYYGPTNRAFAALEFEQQAALRHDLEQLWTQHNRAVDGITGTNTNILR